MTAGKRWMDWRPEMLEAHPETLPTKPTKDPFEGSVGSDPWALPNIRRSEHGAARPTQENELRPIADRCNEALELLGELTHFFNRRLEALEATGMSQDKAIEAAKLPVKVSANITIRALDAISKGLRRR